MNFNNLRAATVADKSRLSGACGHPYPSVEYFADEYFECTLGFSCTYPDEARVQQWLTNNFNNCADVWGDEAALFLHALLEDFMESGNEMYEYYEGVYGDDYEALYMHEAEFDPLADETLLERVYSMFEDFVMFPPAANK